MRSIRAVYKEGYGQMSNPFYHRGPIREPRFFFARGKETRAVMRLLAGAQNCAVLGPVKSGKTSFLLHLGRPDVLAEYGLAPSQTTVVHLSFEGLGGLNAEQFFHLLLRETAGQTRGKMTLIWPRLEARPGITFLELRDALDQLEAAGERLIICLDEVGLAAENPSFDLNFFSSLRHIAARPSVCFVTATERPLHELKTAGREVGSPFADLFSTVRLGPLEADAAAKSVSGLAATAGVDLTAELDLIPQLAGGWPYYLQVVAYEVVEAKTDNAQLTAEQRHYVRARAYEQLEPVLSMIWERLNEGQREAALAALAAGGAPLAVAGLTTAAGGPAEPAGALVARFLAERRADAIPEGDFSEYLDTDAFRADRTMMYGVVRALMRAVEGRDRYAREHADRVARIASLVATEMGCDPEVTEGIRVAGRLHDIGRVSISDMIILKPGPLTELEREIVCTHPLVGAQILDALEFPWSVKPAVRYHHERLDGSGYPEGLMGQEIPLGARILAVADVMAAMTEDRPYRRAHAPEEARAELRMNAGSKYDSQVVSALDRLIARGDI